MKDKISDLSINEIAPLYKVWTDEAKLDKTESDVLYHKLFNPNKPTEIEIAEMLGYEERTIRRIWKKVRNKIYKILP